MPEGSVNGGGIGCHAMVALTDREGSAVSSITQMGGEGAQWIGQSAFLAASMQRPAHMFQNMGDGTLAHSGQLCDPARAGATPAHRLGPAQAACYLAFDLLVGADARNLGYADPERTVAVVSTSTTPTGAQVRDASVSTPATVRLVERVRGQVRELVELDAAAAALALFGDAMPANFLLVGAAHQSGVLPISAAAIEAAIGTNGVAVTANTGAFRWGRVAVTDPDAFCAAVGPPAVPAPEPEGLDLEPLSGETRWE